MAKTVSPRPAKKKAKKTYQKKLSLHPMTFEQAVDAVLKHKPKDKPV